MWAWSSTVILTGTLALSQSRVFLSEQNQYWISTIRLNVPAGIELCKGDHTFIFGSNFNISFVKDGKILLVSLTGNIEAVDFAFNWLEFVDDGLSSLAQRSDGLPSLA